MWSAAALQQQQQPMVLAHMQQQQQQHAMHAHAMQQQMMQRQMMAQSPYSFGTVGGVAPMPVTSTATPMASATPAAVAGAASWPPTSPYMSPTVAASPAPTHPAPQFGAGGAGLGASTAAVNAAAATAPRTIRLVVNMLPVVNSRPWALMRLLTELIDIILINLVILWGSGEIDSAIKFVLDNDGELTDEDILDFAATKIAQ
jgi:hypothetical protein